jgi:hypothetical protein
MTVTKPPLVTLWRKEAVAPNSPRRCTVPPLTVYTATSSDHPQLGRSEPAQSGNATGVTVHRTRGGGATQAPNPFPKLQTLSHFVPWQLRAPFHKRY